MQCNLVVKVDEENRQRVSSNQQVNSTKLSLSYHIRFYEKCFMGLQIRNSENFLELCIWPEKSYVIPKNV